MAPPEISQRPTPRITISSPTPVTPSRPSWIPFVSGPSGEYHRLPTTSNSPSELFQGPPPSRRRLVVAVVCCLAILGLMSGIAKRRYRNGSEYAKWGVEGLIENKEGIDEGMEGLDETKDMWGWTEEMGWRQDEEVGLKELGEVAEESYMLHVAPGEAGLEEYFRRLHDLIHSLPDPLQPRLFSSLSAHLPPSHQTFLPAAPGFRPAPSSMVSYKTIYQTDKNRSTLGEESQAWADMNRPDGWELRFLSDKNAQEWVEDKFKGSEVEWAWDYMHRGVLRADFLRYLLPLIRGGVYTDVDTRPLRPIEQWGLLHPEYLNLTATDGPSWRSKLSTFPAVIVAIDVDVHAHPTWEIGWPRPLGICQWTLGSAPFHPIFLDAVRRVINATRVVEAWEENRREEIARLEIERPDGWQVRVKEMGKWGRSKALSVMEWTGPGLFTDSVLAFLLARYNVTWHRLRGLDHPLRIGDVMILPITAFSPGGEPDFRAEGPDSPQANVLHDFRGSWKSAGL